MTCSFVDRSGWVRVAAWPATGANPYLDLFYAAMAQRAVTLVAGLQINDAVLRMMAPSIDALHIQWYPEAIWRARGGGATQRLRGVVGLWRYLVHGKSAGLQIVWTVHDLEHHEGSDSVDRLGYLLLAGAADLVICHSQWCRREFVKRYRHFRGDVIVIPIGNYDGVFPPAAQRRDVLERIGLNPSKRTLAALGTLRHYKGIDLLIGEMTRLGTDYQLIVAGEVLEPDYRLQLHRLCATVPGVCLIDTFVNNQTYADLTHAADCIVLPYRRVTGSSALLSAATLGRGVVAADLPFFREVLAPEPQAGVLFTPGEGEALRGAITEFFEGPVAERHAAARRLADLYDWNLVVAPIAEWLKRRCGVRAARDRVA